MASTFITLLRNAGGTANIAAFSTPEYQKWTENVSRIMSCFGMDVSKNLTVNGMKYYYLSRCREVHKLEG